MLASRNKDILSFIIWHKIGVGTPKNILFTFLFGNNWEIKSIKECSNIINKKFNIDISTMDIYNAFSVLISIWEKSSGKSYVKLRNEYSGEEYYLVTKKLC